MYISSDFTDNLYWKCKENAGIKRIIPKYYISKNCYHFHKQLFNNSFRNATR